MVLLYRCVLLMLEYIQSIWYIPMISLGFIVSCACFINLSSFTIITINDSFIFVLIRELTETLATFLYLPAFLINSIGLLVSFGTVLHFSLSSTEVAAFTESFILARYTASTRRSHLPKYRTPSKFSPSICFMGGGQLWMFAIGCGHYVYENFDISQVKFLASSCGTFAAVPLACGLDPYDWCRKDWSKCITHFNNRGIFGCLCDSKFFYYNIWNDYLPEDAHIRCSGRLFLSVTLFPSLKNRVISHFNTREDLIWAIVGSICVPFVFIRDFPVKCSDDVGYVIDGGFSNDSPCLDSYTITVSALHQEADIRPLDPSYRIKQQQQQKMEMISPSKALSSSVETIISDSSKTKEDHEIQLMTPRRSNRILNSKIQQRSSGSSVESNPLYTDGTIDKEMLSKKTDVFTSTGLIASSTAASSSILNDIPQMSMNEEDAIAYRQKIRIRSLDIIRVPKYDRVWEVGSLGIEAAANCIDFNRYEWTSIRINKKV